MSRYSHVCLLLIILLGCAHKAAPLVKDRMKPKLQNAFALNNRQVQFTFSEAIDTLNLKSDYISITNNSDTLEIITLYPSLSAAEIVALTKTQTNITYDVSGYVYDTAENKGSFTAKFKGTSKPDTIKPWIVRFSRGAPFTSFYLQFSEAMDTTFLSFRVMPFKNLTPNWLNLRSCYLTPVDTLDRLGYDTTYYLYIKKGARDISNNVCADLITFVTPDTIYKPLLIKGSAQIDDSLVGKGYAVLFRDIPLGLTFLEAGNFQFEVRDSSMYYIEVISGQYAGSGPAYAGSTNVIILHSAEKNIDNFFD